MNNDIADGLGLPPPPTPTPEPLTVIPAPPEPIAPPTPPAETAVPVPPVILAGPTPPPAVIPTEVDLPADASPQAMQAGGSSPSSLRDSPALTEGVLDEAIHEEKPKEENPKKKVNKKLVFGGTLVLLLLGGALALAAQLGLFRGDIRQLARYTEVGVGIANITDNSMSVWWLQGSRVGGCVTITDTKSQKQVNKCDEKESRIHLIDVSGLNPGSSYRVDIKHGGVSVPLGPFWGQAIWTRYAKAKQTPERVSGRVIDSKNRPITDAIVFVGPTASDRMYIPLAVTTNELGIFSVDLAILKMQSVDISGSLFVEVTSKDGIKLVEKIITRVSPTTLPDVLVNSQ